VTGAADIVGAPDCAFTSIAPHSPVNRTNTECLTPVFIGSNSEKFSGTLRSVSHRGPSADAQADCFRA
jgi:hypothetical protein